MSFFAGAGAQADVKTMSSIKWWSTFESETPALAKVANKVFSQPISSSSVGRSWSTYQYIHNSKRNRLSYGKVDKLVYIHYNSVIS